MAWDQATDGSSGGFDGHRADDQLWSGFSRLGLVAATGLVGSYDTVARRIDELGSAGIEAFVLDGAPRSKRPTASANRSSPGSRRGRGRP